MLQPPCRLCISRWLHAPPGSLLVTCCGARHRTREAYSCPVLQRICHEEHSAPRSSTHLVLDLDPSTQDRRSARVTGYQIHGRLVRMRFPCSLARASPAHPHAWKMRHLASVEHRALCLPTASNLDDALTYFPTLPKHCQENTDSQHVTRHPRQKVRTDQYRTATGRPVCFQSPKRTHLPKQL